MVNNDDSVLVHALVDLSGSMRGESIASANYAIEIIQSSVRQTAALGYSGRICLHTFQRFGDCVQAPTLMGDFTAENLSINEGGPAHLAEGLENIRQCDLSYGSPTSTNKLILISDGRIPLQRFEIASLREIFQRYLSSSLFLVSGIESEGSPLKELFEQSLEIGNFHHQDFVSFLNRNSELPKSAQTETLVDRPLPSIPSTISI